MTSVEKNQPSFPTPFLSLIIPAYNEEQRLGDSLNRIRDYLRTQPYTAEVIVVDDGSTDHTPDIVEAHMQTDDTLRLIRAAHGGKGCACKHGVFASRGAWLFLCDSDLSMPIEELARFVPLFQPTNDVIIASREVPGAHRYDEPKYRHMMGRVFNWMVRSLAVHNIQDTQCGFKGFRAEVAQDIFGVQTIDGWGFDVEILFVAQKRDYRILEVPINWYYHGQSKVKPLQDAIRMFREVWLVRLNDWRGRYQR